MTVETQRGAMVMPAGRLGWIPALHEHRARTFEATDGWSIYLSPRLAARLPITRIERFGLGINKVDDFHFTLAAELPFSRFADAAGRRRA